MKDCKSKTGDYEPEDIDLFQIFQKNKMNKKAEMRKEDIALIVFIATFGSIFVGLIIFWVSLNV